MIRGLSLTTILIALAAFASPVSAQHRHAASLDANGNLDALIARHAAANNVPESLMPRVVRRESGGNPRIVHAGNVA
jgi:soluble lytic murein transglycosylase-like protein